MSSVDLDNALHVLVRLVPEYSRRVVPPLNAQGAECIAIVLIIRAANQGIDRHASKQIAARLVPNVAALPESAWYGNEMGLYAHLAIMSRMLINWEAQLSAKYPSGINAILSQTLFLNHIVDLSIVHAGAQIRTDEERQALMSKIDQFEGEIFPLVRSAGKPKLSPAAAQFLAQQRTGCLIPIVVLASAFCTVATAAVAWLLI